MATTEIDQQNSAILKWNDNANPAYDKCMCNPMFIDLECDEDSNRCYRAKNQKEKEKVIL